MAPTQDYFSLLMGTTPASKTDSPATGKVANVNVPAIGKGVTAHYTLFEGRPMLIVEVPGAAELRLSLLKFERAKRALAALDAAGVTPPAPKNK